MNAPQFFGAMFGPLRGLGDFSGRSTRREFWPFVFLLYAAQQIGAMIAINPFLASIQRFSEADQQGRLTDADRVYLAQQIVPFFNNIVLISLASAAVSIVLLAAAITRRLHDTDRRGFWALPLIVLSASSILLMLRFLSLFAEAPAKLPDFETGLSAFWPLLANNIVYLVLFAIITIFCAQDGTPGSNRFGEDPKGRDPIEEAERRAGIAEAQQRRQAARRDPALRPPPARIVSTDPSDER